MTNENSNIDVLFSLTGMEELLTHPVPSWPKADDPNIHTYIGQEQHK